jgi:hypothetical protein
VSESLIKEASTGYSKSFNLVSTSEVNHIAIEITKIIPDLFIGCYVFENTLRIMTKEELSENQISKIQTLISNSTDDLSIQRTKIKEAVKNAIEFGESLIIDFSADSIALGITQLGITDQLIEKTSKVINALKTGSLYLAIDEIKNIPISNLDATILTPLRLKVFRNKIEAYLGIDQLSSEYNQ